MNSPVEACGEGGWYRYRADFACSLFPKQGGFAFVVGVGPNKNEAAMANARIFLVVASIVLLARVMRARDVKDTGPCKPATRSHDALHPR